MGSIYKVTNHEKVDVQGTEKALQFLDMRANFVNTNFNRNLHFCTSGTNNGLVPINSYCLYIDSA